MYIQRKMQIFSFIARGCNKIREKQCKTSKRKIRNKTYYGCHPLYFEEKKRKRMFDGPYVHEILMRQASLGLSTM